MCVCLSILSGSGRSRGEGRFGRNAGGKALFSPHPALLFCLLFSVFSSSALRLGVSAPVRASCSLRGERGLFVFVTVSRPLWVEMFNHGPAARRKEASPDWQRKKSGPVASQRGGEGVKSCPLPARRWQKS